MEARYAFRKSQLLDECQVRLTFWKMHVSRFISARSCRRPRGNGDKEHLCRSAIRRSEATNAGNTSVAHSADARTNLLTPATVKIQLADFI